MRKLTTCLLIFGAVHLHSTAQMQTGETIAVTSTESGSVRGYVHNGVFTYKGMPYAEANRFEAAEKPKPWKGVRSSLTYGPVAPLTDPTTQVQDESEFVFHHDWGFTNENCLRINVWTPGINDGKKRPVLFWIHGGGFTAGSSQELPSYDGENLAKTGDVVVVSINHRLNILGYLDLSAYGEKYKHSANNSILDIKVALEWVKTNIANFGGDPGNVTIFGQSGGGAKVNALMAMPSAKGLFQKAINESGAFTSNMPDRAVTRDITVQLLKILNIDASNVDTLQKIPFQVLSDAGKKALQAEASKMRAEGKTITGFGLGWAPSLDGEDFPYQISSREADALSKDIPLLIGTTKNEFAGFMAASLNDSSLEKITAAIRQQRGDKTDAFIAAVKKAYPNDSKPSDLIAVDAMFRPGAIVQANQKSSVAGGAPVYMYLFTWQSPVMNGKYKAIHCMELPFVFNNIRLCEEMTGGGKEAYALAEQVSKAWVSFARTGNPNHKGLPNWPAYTAQNTATMHFDNVCAVMPQVDKDYFDLAGPR